MVESTNNSASGLTLDVDDFTGDAYFNLNPKLSLSNFNRLIGELLEDIKRYPDNECFNSSVEKERLYILHKSKRIKCTIRHFYKFLNNKNSSNNKSKILDIGTSPFTFLYKKFFNARISSVDLTDFMKRRCAVNNIIFKTCNLLEEDIPFREKEFDAVIFTEVLEHLAGPPQIIFDRIRKVLNDEGILVLSTPNISSYYNIIKLLLGKPILTPACSLFKKDKEGRWVASGYGHWRKYTMSELIEMLQKYGFKVLRYKRIIKPFIDIKTGNPLKFLLRLTWNAMASILPASQFNLIIARRKK